MARSTKQQSNKGKKMIKGGNETKTIEIYDASIPQKLATGDLASNDGFIGFFKKTTFIDASSSTIYDVTISENNKIIFKTDDTPNTNIKPNISYSYADNNCKEYYRLFSTGIPLPVDISGTDISGTDISGSPIESVVPETVVTGEMANTTSTGMTNTTATGMTQVKGGKRKSKKSQKKSTKKLKKSKKTQKSKK